MGQKVNPIGMRVGVIRDWQSRWYADDKKFGDTLMEDVKIREHIEEYYKKLADKAVDRRKADPQISRIEIERSKNRLVIIVRTGHPGVVIGAEGKSIEGLKKQIEKMTSAKYVQINVVEVANPNLDARLVARNTMRAGAKGIKTSVSGRLGGADMARTEGYAEGVVPLHTLRSDIDYAIEEAATQYGKVGVKVWICRGEVLPGEMVKEPEAPKQRPRRRRKNFNNKRPQNRAPKQVAAPADKGGNE